MLQILFCGTGLLAQQVEVRKVESRRHLEIPIKIKTKKNEVISNPVSWAAVNFLEPDGARVEKGQVVIGFDPGGTEDKLADLLLRQAVIDANLHAKMTEIADKQLSMQESLESKIDERAVLEAQLKRYEAFPDEDEIRIAEGRLKVASMNHEAALVEVERATERYERGMISPAELRNFKRQLEEQVSNLKLAEEELEIASLPAATSTLTRIGLEIENLDKDIARLEDELVEYESIAEIQKKGARARKGIIDRKVEEAREDITKMRVEAPIDGYLSYRLMNGDYVMLGSKMWKNSNIMHIPDLETVYAHGEMRESERKHFEQADRVEIRLGPLGAQSLTGTVREFSKAARDLADKPEGSWGSVNREFGVKVYDVFIDFDEPNELIKPGMSGEATLIASLVREGPAVPLRFVRARADRYWISVGGVYQPVSGSIVQEWFFIEEEDWLGRVVDFQGTFEEGLEGASQEDGRTNYSATGEITPIHSIEVLIQEIGGWFKLKWMIEEDSLVKEGDIVAEIESEDIDNRIQDRSNRLTEAKSNLDEQLKRAELSVRERKIALENAVNQEEIARLKMRTALYALDYTAIAQKENALRQSEIRLADLRQKLKAEKEREMPTMAAWERKALERNLRRAELTLERNQIDLSRLKEGSNPIEKRTAERTYRNKQIEREILEERNERDAKNAESNLAGARAGVEWNERSLRRVERYKENLSVRSPGNGLIRYQKIWSSGAISKVQLGAVVGERFSIMQIPDLTRVFLSVEVPERYFGQVKLGMPVEVEIPSLGERLVQGEISDIDFLFENKQRKDSQVGLYSSQEPLGEVIFVVRVNLLEGDLGYKPGSQGIVHFPFDKDG